MIGRVLGVLVKMGKPTKKPDTINLKPQAKLEYMGVI
jgi:hypothetical protein|tara:strand:+ start:197 stop:307 length:111 start_codon:yes stop_codon:yes gene_type:complete